MIYPVDSVIHLWNKPDQFATAVVSLFGVSAILPTTGTLTINLNSIILISRVPRGSTTIYTCRLVSQSNYLNNSNKDCDWLILARFIREQSTLTPLSLLVWKIKFSLKIPSRAFPYTSFVLYRFLRATEQSAVEASIFVNRRTS